MDDESCLIFVLCSFFFRLLLEFTFLLEVCVSKVLGKFCLISHLLLSFLLYCKLKQWTRP